MTEMKNNKLKVGNVPNLRFPGFEGEWEVKKLGEVAIIGRGKSKHRPRDAAFLFGGIYPFIQTGDIKKADLFLENYTQTYSDEGLRQSKLWDEDTLCITIAANIAETAILKIKACFPDSIIGLIPEPEHSTVLFIKYCFDRFKADIQKLSQGVAQDNLNIEKLSNIKFFFPSIAEQKKISDLLHLLDQRISTQNKIIEELKLLKNTASTKIFSRKVKFVDNNTNIFPDWIPTELSELMSIPEKKKAINIDNKKLLTVKLHLKGVMRNGNTDTLSLGSTHYFVRKKGQFIYGKQNLFNGAFAIIPDEFDGFLSSGDVPSLEINTSKINAVYLLNYLGRESFYKRLEDLATGSGSKRVHESTLLKVQIELPIIKEQEKIANFFFKIDAKISIESKYLSNLEKQKQFLLSNLFI